MTQKFSVAFVPVFLCASCDRTPSEPAKVEAPRVDPPALKPTEPKPTDTTLTATSKAAESTGGDPVGGNWSLKDATAGLPDAGKLYAKVDTSMGALSCKLYDDKAPNTVANFVGLARGVRPWKDPGSGAWVKKPAYDGTTFHRVIAGFMIQGGDPKGNGTGEPGYVIPDELWEGGKHDKAGLLCMANRGHNTNGAQFFITDDAAAHLDGNYTIFGECTPVDTVHAIAKTPVNGEKPKTPVTIKTVTIERKKA